MNDKFTAVVLAGGKALPDFTKSTGVTNRALVELAPNRTMLDFVIEALYGAQLVGRVFIVGDIPTDKIGALAPSGCEEARILAPGDSLIDNILIGLESAGSQPDESVLMVSADIPFVSSEAIDDYAARAAEAHADFCYPIVPMAEYNRQYPTMKRTTLKLREGEFTGGNIMLCRAGVLTANPGAVRAAYAGRKSVFRIGGMLGWGLLLRIAVSQLAMPSLLNIPLLEQAIGRILGAGATARAIITNHASIGTDVDKPEDVIAAREILSRMTTASSQA
jgi:GTP:adenosylcobinamide-phosphate guanylyltransferase